MYLLGHLYAISEADCRKDIRHRYTYEHIQRRDTCLRKDSYNYHSV